MEEQFPIEIEPRAVQTLQHSGEDFLLVDCRQPDEWEIVRLDGATLLPMQEIVARAGELEPHRSRRIVVHCHHGGRSRRVVEWLRQQGFDKAQNMTGGIDAWASDIDSSLARY